MRYFILSLCFLAFITPVTAFAQQEGGVADVKSKKPAYHALGSPSQPSVTAHWNRFHDYTQSSNLLKELAAKHPRYARLQSLGKTYGKRDMWVLTITDFGDAEGDEAKALADSKPGFWIDGGIHANEIQSVEVVLYTAWYLLEMRSRSETIARLLKERTFYLLPMMSPDSRDAHFYEANTTHSPRTGMRPNDDDRDGRLDEDGPDDLDGDGHILQMRIADKNGEYKQHEKFPALMVRVEPGEKGTHNLLGPEGIDNDGDGRVNEDGDGYYDPNRDWPWNWQPGNVQRGAWRYPLSVPENRLVADFISTKANIAGAQTYHNAGGMILRGPGAKNDSYPRSDIAVLDSIVDQGQKMLPGYRYIIVATELYEVFGGEFDWWMQMRGVYVFNNELWTPFNYLREHEDGGGFFGTSETQHLFDKYLLLGDASVAWKEVDHPQYGKVEVGGFKKNFLRQPPGFLLEEECHRNMAFTLFHADEMPLVKIQSASAKKLGNDLVEITAIIENPKLTPTHSAVDLNRKITPPDTLAISGDDLEVVVGMKSSERFFQSPSLQSRNPNVLRLANISNHGIVYARWLVTGKPPYKLSLKSIKGGSDEMIIKDIAE